MPGDHRIRQHEDERLGPMAPKLMESNPEDPIEWVQAWTGLAALVDRQLLQKGGNFESQIVTRCEIGSQVREHRKREWKHHFDATALPHSANRGASSKFVIPLSNDILMTDRSLLFRASSGRIFLQLLMPLGGIVNLG